MLMSAFQVHYTANSRALCPSVGNILLKPQRYAKGDVAVSSPDVLNHALHKGITQLGWDVRYSCELLRCVTAAHLNKQRFADSPFRVEVEGFDELLSINLGRKILHTDCSSA